MYFKTAFSIIFLLISLPACNKENESFCINALDCDEGYECLDGSCVKKSTQNDNYSFSDNENNDLNPKPDNNPVVDNNEINDEQEDQNNYIDNENNEKNDEDCYTNSCGSICSNILTNECYTKSDCRCEPVKHFDNFANPSVFKDSNDKYFITGTGVETNSLVVSISYDLIEYETFVTYNPSEIDTEFDYCCIRSPEIYKTTTDTYRIYFSAKRVSQSSVCDCSDISNITIFYAEYDEGETNFKTPVPVNFGEGNPQYRTEADCSVHGCEKTVRTDAAIINDSGTEWFFWTWFENGSNISSIKTNSPANIISNLKPSVMEGNVNEGANAFYREGKYYLFYTVKTLENDYSIKYLFSDKIEGLVRERIPRVFSQSVYNITPSLIQTNGHSSVVERYGDYYIFYYQGRFDTPGTLSGGDTYKSRLHFREDGSIHSFNTIDIGWSDAGEGFKYSIDIKPKGGDWIKQCLGPATVGSSKKYIFNGYCKDNPDTFIYKGTIEKIRLYYSNNEVWDDSNMVETNYDGYSSDISLRIPDKFFDHLKIRFAQQNTNDIYSIDIKVKNGGWFAPCIGSLQLSKPLSLTGDFVYNYLGTCLAEPNNGTVISVDNIDSIRVCSDKNDEWKNAVCFEKKFDGLTRYIEVW